MTAPRPSAAKTRLRICVMSLASNVRLPVKG
jgi:hypothetical protein